MIMNANLSQTGRLAWTCLRTAAAVLLVGGLTLEVSAQSSEHIKVVVNPGTVPAAARKDIKIDVIVDVPLRSNEPNFAADLHISGGRITEDRSRPPQNASTIPPPKGDRELRRADFIINGSGGRARGAVYYNLELVDPVQPGEIRIRVAGAGRIGLLGQVDLGGATHIGSGRLIITPPTTGSTSPTNPGSGGPPPTRPPERPPGIPTSGPLNPPDDLIKLIAAIVCALVLGTIDRKST